MSKLPCLFLARPRVSCRNSLAQAPIASSMGLMPKRRLKDAGLPPIFGPHTLRVLVVTDLLS